MITRVEDGQTIGKIVRVWSGATNPELANQQDYFVSSFPLELDANLKASILAATILIDFMFFEEKPSKYLEILQIICAGLAAASEAEKNND